MNLGQANRIDNYIVSFNEKENPKLLFIQTASHDVKSYINSVRNNFESLGCKVDVLCLYSNNYAPEELRTVILESGIIYVGGWDTVRMIEKWYEANLHFPEFQKHTIMYPISYCNLFVRNSGNHFS